LKLQRPGVAIVYMRDISQNSNKPPKLAELAQALPAPLTFSLVIVTSQWDSLPFKKLGEDREGQLREALAGLEMGRATKLMRIERKPADQTAVVNYLLNSVLG
jgi:hypothetical protein